MKRRGSKRRGSKKGGGWRPWNSAEAKQRNFERLYKVYSGQTYNPQASPYNENEDDYYDPKLRPHETDYRTALPGFE